MIQVLWKYIQPFMFLFCTLLVLSGCSLLPTARSEGQATATAETYNVGAVSLDGEVLFEAEYTVDESGRGTIMTNSPYQEEFAPDLSWLENRALLQSEIQSLMDNYWLYEEDNSDCFQASGGGSVENIFSGHCMSMPAAVDDGRGNWTASTTATPWLCKIFDIQYHPETGLPYWRCTNIVETTHEAAEFFPWSDESLEVPIFLAP